MLTHLLLTLFVSQVPVDTTCPGGTKFVEGKGCVAKVAQPKCPAGTHFDGAKCVANVDTTCPAGMKFVKGTGCVENDPKATAGPANDSGGYSEAEVEALVQSLGEQHSLSKEKLLTLTRSVSTHLSSPELQKVIAAKPIRAVFVYNAGEGGLVVKFMSGKGLATIRGGHSAAKISLKSVSAGAQIGGSAMWGVGLMMGLKKESDFGGDYTGEMKGATAAELTAGRPLVLTREHMPQELWVFTTGRGLSAGVSGVKLTVVPEW